LIFSRVIDLDETKALDQKNPCSKKALIKKALIKKNLDQKKP
jgi:hypothetical protein